MGMSDAAVAIIVILAFFYIMFARIGNKYPQFKEWTRSFNPFRKVDLPPTPITNGISEQVYTERRAAM